MKTPLFTGTCTAIVTPFTGSEVSLKEFDRLLDAQLDAGVSAIVVCGTTGEAATLSDEEKLLLISHAVTHVKGRCKIIAGTGSNDTAHAVHLSKMAQSYGADGLLVVTPYYNKTSQTGLLRHYAAISEAVSLPVIVYHIPSRTGLHIQLETYQALVELPNINGVKEASSDLPLVSRILAACGDRLNIWAGNDDQIVAMMSLGAKGVISTLSNVAPKTVVRMTNACLTSDYVTAARLQNESMALIDALFSQINPLPVKLALQQMGYAVGDCRLPLFLDDSQKQSLCEQFQALLGLAAQE